jgi:hypothetical protein
MILEMFVKNDTPEKYEVCALPRLNLFNVSMLRVELALVGG